MSSVPDPLRHADSSHAAPAYGRAWVLIVLLLATGFAMTAGGASLLVHGGSWYYVFFGLMCIASAVLFWARNRAGLWVYSLALLVTLLWSLLEVGANAWALLPRLDLAALFGAWIMTPGLRRSLKLAPLKARSVAIALVGAGALIAVVVLADHGDIIVSDAPIDRKPISSGAPSAADADWAHYGADAGGSRFSRLAQITSANVNELQEAWEFRVGNYPPGSRTGLQVTPLKIADTLYFCTGFNDVIALDAETGAQRWRFDAHIDPMTVIVGTCRGVAYYQVSGAVGKCRERIYTATVDAQLIALDAKTGELCSDFGEQGKVNLLNGLGKMIPGYYFVTSAPVVVRGKVVMGAGIPDNQYVGEPSGVIRAFDAVTGKLAWAWDMDHPDWHGDPPPGENYGQSTANSWAPISADEQLGMVYLPMGVGTPDYYLDHRSQANLKYSSSVVALDADSGSVHWSFQTTHRDIWDYDVASQPTLVDIPSASGAVPALIQPTKRGEIFVLDRRTGEPISEVRETAVPQQTLAGLQTSATQPFSTAMPSFGVPHLLEQDMWGLTPFDQLWCRIQYRKARYDGTLTPIGLDPSIAAPGYLGGIDWGGVSVDPDQQLMVVNSNRMVNYNYLIPRSQTHVEPTVPRQRDDNSGGAAQAGTPYAVSVQAFMSPLQVPCQAPPYGLISVVDLQAHRILWSQPFGTGRDSGPLGYPSGLPFRMGVPNIGGSAVTASGLVFIAASSDQFLRAFDIHNGQELWRARLPAGGQATPMTYLSQPSGRQFVVLAVGGHPYMRTKAGDYIIAYALPRK